MNLKKTLLSGIQPSGILTIGNYIGAIKNWVKLQDEFDCFFTLVDLHALTVKQNPKDFHNRCLDFISLLLACGIDSKKSNLFIQSHIPPHLELTWVLGCFTQFGDLSRMTQFKDKSKKNKDNINAGLFTYPVLMAADILIYNADVVPVGNDQKQHIELARDIAQKFNDLYGKTFTVPEPYIPKMGARIMSLSETDKKMSKSDENPNNYIALTDKPEIIKNKIKRAVTDSLKTIEYNEKRPGISNLVSIYSTLTDKSFEQIEKLYEGKGYADFKKDLADILIEFLSPIQKEFERIRNDKKYIGDVLSTGALNANKKAERTVEKVYKKIGLVLKGELI